MDRPDAGAAGSSPLGATTATPSARHRRRPDRRRMRIQRIVILGVVLFVVVFAVAWGARSCQQNRKVDSYRTYLDAVSVAINDSAELLKQLDKVVDDPTKFSRKELTATLDELTAKQSEIATRAEGLQPPDPLKREHAVFVEGMRVRADGFTLLRTSMLAGLNNETVTPGSISALAGYFSGPDAYYMSRFYAQTRTIMGEQGVTDVAVPTATAYLTTKAFDSTRIETMLASVGRSAKLVGIRGVGLLGVAAQPADAELDAGSTSKIAASADLSFEVRIQNQGDVAEENVAVKGELKLPGGGILTQTSSIALIGAGQTQTVALQGFAIPAEALSKVSTLTVTAGPVPGERVKTNNTASYRILLQLQ